MLRQAISNHPVITDITREVELKEINFDEQKRHMYMEIYVYHYMLKDGKQLEIKKFDTHFKLVADNSKMIDGVHDYNYIIEQVELNAPINTLISNIIGIRDADGTINDKCNYDIVFPEENEIVE